MLKGQRCLWDSITFLSKHRLWNLQTRLLNLQEYQSKGLLEENGCSVQKFVVASSVAEAKEKLKNFKLREYVVKAQILAGGRGKGRFIGGPPDLSGVHISYKESDALKAVEQMLGRRLRTNQTSEEGVLVEKVMIADGVYIARETYLAVLLCRDKNGPVIEHISISKGISLDEARRIATKLHFKGNNVDKAAEEVIRLYKLFLKVDAVQVEINPFVETVDGRVICVDAKMNFDDSAAFRQKEIFAMEDETEKDPREVAAHKHHLNYIGLDGNIACLVNGAGLAMATMDVIKLYGGEPANFLDVGGSVTEDQVKQAFTIITDDPKVECVLVNVFGGIVNCVTIANGIVAAAKFLPENIKKVVVRLDGTSVQEGREILAKSGLSVEMARNLDEAAKKAVLAVQTA